MSTPRSKFVSDNLAKVRPKLPLYSNKKSEKSTQSKSVTMDDILRSVKTLDDNTNVKKLERPSSFSQSGDLKKFQPCSSLNNAGATNHEFEESCVLDEFSVWELGTENKDPTTPSKSAISNDGADRSPILNTSKVGLKDKLGGSSSRTGSSSFEDKLRSSQNVVSIKSRKNLVSEENGDVCSFWSDIIVEENRTDLAESVSNDAKDAQQQNLDPLKEVPAINLVESLAESENPDFKKETGQVVRNPSPVKYSQGSFDNEANAALSVFDVSDFLSCSRAKATKRDLLSQLVASNDSSDFRVPVVPTRFTRDIVETGSLKDDSTNSCSMNITVTEISSNSAPHLQRNLDSSDKAMPDMLNNDKPGVISSSDSQRIRSPFISANGNECTISSENFRKAAVLFEACNDDSSGLSPVGNIAETVEGQFANQISDLLEVQPASSQLLSQNIQLSTDTGFCSAGGRNIFVSEKSLIFASSLLDSVENMSKSGECSKASSTEKHGTSPRLSKSNQQYMESLFSTASGKPMTISTANLEKAKTLFDECSDLHDPSDPGPSKTNRDTSAGVDVESGFPDGETLERSPSVPERVGLSGETTGFTTAGGKKVYVSEKSLHFASQLLEYEGAEGNIELPEASSEFTISRANNSQVDHYRKSLFQSASGHPISVSTANLRKAKNLLDSLDYDSSELTSTSKREKMQNVTESGVEFPDICTPENAALLDNDDELFQAIETPSKVQNIAAGPTSTRQRVSQDIGLVKSCSDEGGVQLSGPTDDLAVSLSVSPTVFNKSGINTQKRSCANSTPTLSLINKQSSPKNEALTSIPKSPVLMNRSFIETPSPHRLKYQKETTERDRTTNCSNESTSKGNVSSLHQNSEARIATRPLSDGSEESDVSSKDPPTGLVFFKTSSGRNIEPSAASMSKIRSLLGDLIDEETDPQVSPGAGNNDMSNPSIGNLLGNDLHDFSTMESEKSGNISMLKEPKTSRLRPDDCLSVSSEIEGATCFKSAAGKSIKVSEESLKRVQTMFSDIMDEDFPENHGKSVVSDDQPGEFCSPVLLDGSFLEKRSQVHSEAVIDGTELLDDRSRSPALNCSVVSENHQSSIEKIPYATVTTSVSSIRAPKEKVLSSPDWGEFPDLKSSQAALLENQNDTPKENSGLEANRQTRKIEWGEFPEMLNTEMHKLEQTKININDHRQKETPLVQDKYGSEKYGFGFASCKEKSVQSVLSTSVTIQRVNKRELDKLEDSEAGRKRKSISIPRNASKKSKPSLSPQKSEDNLNKLALRKSIREQQCFIVRSKRKQQIQPKCGKLFTRKEKGCRWQLKDLDGELRTLEENHVEVGISKTVIYITSENSVDYRFCYSRARAKNLDFVEGNVIADSCLLAYADDNTAGLKETTTAFLTSPHVDPKLTPNGWIRNHYRWIVWKLACMERTFPEQFGGSCLTLENVLLQLKYRYDREIDKVQRSCFKKLLEGDEAPKKMICCVAAIKKNNLDEGDSLLELELTDGWYSIWTVIDSEMVDLVKRDVVGIGTKLIIHSAELTNCEQGCDPLNVPGNVKFKISTNSVRRVKWFAKMGFMSNNNPIPALLCSVLPNGGIIGQVTAVVARRYPVIYMCKDGDGKTVFRNERSQALFKEQQEKIKNDRAEQVYEQVWKEVESKYRKPGKSSTKLSSKAIQNITNPEQLFNIMDGSDAEFIQSQLSADQLRMVMQYKEEMMTKIKNEVQKVLQDKLSASEPTCKITKLLKIRLMDLFTDKYALLTIWRPSEDDLSVLCEGKAFEFLNLIASGTRDKVLQLSSTRQTSFVSNGLLEPSEDCGRTVTLFSEFDSPGFAPVFGEIDVVGVVVLLKLPEQTRGVTVVYLSDLEGRYLSITFWTSLSVFGCEDLMAEGSVISCSNLQWRSVSNQRKIPSVFASEITSFSLNPKESHLQRSVAELKTKIADKDVEELVHQARTRFLQMSGFRDGSSSPAPSTPLSSARSTPAQKKLKLMSRYGEDASPLSPFPLVVTTRHVFQDFKSPCRTPLGPKSKQS
ncbi:hypothetical protein GE061_005144 [Apolygus lucorum]|uniref:Tower domain-containing protein n=1 Tax=Apolygus lucorum TaxID=248454 RepID=A0A8S9WUU2_APOLU|nr:hypothetical protein GE061_005144 [Apolygus lucorum]